MSSTGYLLETERLGLRLLRQGDAAALAQVFADPYAKRFYPGWSDISVAEKWIAKNLQRYQEDGFGLWAVCLKSSGEMIGDCGLMYQTVETLREVEVGYHLRADHRGKGLATEAAHACLDYGFARLECERLVSMVHPANDASRRVAARIHLRSRRFERQGELYYLFYTDRPDWLTPHPSLARTRTDL